MRNSVRNSRTLGTRLALVCVVLTPITMGAQILETETARPLRPGQVEAGAGYEFQHSSEGNETAIPFAFELGITNRLGLLVEPVAYTAIRPKAGQSATGPGDLEITASYLLRNESGGVPAFALALEEKVPTARNNLIGTGKPDHAAYLIASKRFGRFDTHANVGYTIVGSPSGQSLSNRVMGALASELSLTASTLLYGEVLASTAAGGGEGAPAIPGTPVVPEASGDQIFGTVGIAHSFFPGSRLSLGVTRDNVGAIQVRPGITLWFH
ncbi:MAG: YjbH domain-containing protein [Gemmatimonadota bacterium]|nr:YjbH domain-containing protein [Gemmatimonadota bacterium]